MIMQLHILIILNFFKYLEWTFSIFRWGREEVFGQLDGNPEILGGDLSRIQIISLATSRLEIFSLHAERSHWLCKSGLFCHLCFRIVYRKRRWKGIEKIQQIILQLFKQARNHLLTFLMREHPYNRHFTSFLTSLTVAPASLRLRTSAHIQSH